MNNRRQYRPQNRFSINSSPMGPYQHRYSGNKNQFGPNNFNSDSTRMGIQDSNLLDPHRTPLQKRTTTGFNDSPRPRPYISDELIVNRVAKYLDKYGRNHRVDYNQMAIDLQQEYPDLKRRKRAALKYHLHKAVAILEVERGLNADESEVIDDDEEEVIEEDDDNDLQSDDPRGRKSPEFAFEGDGDVNSALENSYLQNAKRSKLAQSGGAQELINIVSSDEDEAEAETPDTTQAQKGTAAGTEPQKAPEEQKSEKTSANTAVVQEAPSTDVRAKKRRVAYKAAHLEAGAKKFKASLQPVNPTVSFKDIGGSEKVLQDVTQLLIHMRHPEVYKTLGVCPPRGFLLHGPPGSGKTLLANAIAGELSVPLLKVTAPELVGGLSGQSEQQIRELFSQAEALAPCVLFIDEIDAITPHRETAHREMERRIVAQLLSSMDELSATESGQRVLVLGATNRPDALDPALRRAGRFDREVCLGIPDRDARQSILQTLSGSLRLDPGLDLAHVAAMTPGFVGADLKSLVTEAAIAAVNRLFKTLHEEKCKETLTIKESKNEDKENVMEVDVGPAPGEEEIKILDSITKEEKEKQIPVVTMDEEGEKTTTDTVEKTDDGGKEVAGVAVAVAKLDNEDDGSQDVQVVHVKTPSLLHSPPFTAEQLKGVYISVADFEVALKTVQPSAKREGFATVPDVRWEDIGSLQDIRHELTMAILAPVRHPRQFAAMGLSSAATGVMLCGPPGCGKTLLAKAVANEAGINFISVKGPELLNMYVGESERAVRQCFQRARSSQPCVIFFDEIDALCPKRSGIESGATRVVNQLLTEMDGVESRTGVFLMAATNRPDIVDPAVMRPGRLDKVLYVGMPAAQDRIDILGALTKGGRRPVLGEDVDLAAVANDPRCEGYTGADLAALVREASLEVLRELVACERDDDTLQATPPVCARHFHTALARIRPSVSDKDKKRYEDLRLQYAAVPSTG